MMMGDTEWEADYNRSIDALDLRDGQCWAREEGTRRGEGWKVRSGWLQSVRVSLRRAMGCAGGRPEVETWKGCKPGVHLVLL